LIGKDVSVFEINVVSNPQECMISLMVNYDSRHFKNIEEVKVEDRIACASIFIVV